MAEKTKTPRTTIEKKKGVPVKKTGRPVASKTAAVKQRGTVTKHETPVPVVESMSVPAPAPRRKPLFPAVTLITVLLLIALIEAVIYLNREKEKTGAEATPTLETAFVFTAADGMVTGIEIEPAEGEAVKIARNTENVWEMLLPIEAEADQGYMEMAVTQLTALSISRQLDDSLSPGTFGFDKPAYVITVEFKDKKPRTLEVGDSAISDGYYIRLDKDRMMIADTSGIESLLNLVVSPPYLNTPTPVALPPAELPVPTAGAAGTSTP